MNRKISHSQINKAESTDNPNSEVFRMWKTGNLMIRKSESKLKVNWRSSLWNPKEDNDKLENLNLTRLRVKYGQTRPKDIVLPVTQKETQSQVVSFDEYMQKQYQMIRSQSQVTVKHPMKPRLPPTQVSIAWQDRKTNEKQMDEQLRKSYLSQNNLPRRVSISAASDVKISYTGFIENTPVSQDKDLPTKQQKPYLQVQYLKYLKRQLRAKAFVLKQTVLIPQQSVPTLP